jgi:tight adherence protein C
LSPILVGLWATALLGLLIAGYRLVSADTLKDMDVGDIVLFRDEEKRKRRRSPIDGLAERLAGRLASLLGPRTLGRLRQRIDLAGRPDGMTVDTFLKTVAKYVLFFGTVALVELLLGQLLVALLCLVAAPILPLSRLAGQQRRRRERIDHDLPDFLDILAVTVSAGIGFRAALGRVTTRFEGPLREEMLLTLNQLDVGVPRRQAFDAMRRRNESEALSSFVTAFLQAEELGAPLANSLTQIARDMRREASQNIRRRAARTVPRVTLVVSMVFVPATLILVLVGLYLGSGVAVDDIFGGL